MLDQFAHFQHLVKQTGISIPSDYKTDLNRRLNKVIKDSPHETKIEEYKPRESTAVVGNNNNNKNQDVSNGLKFCKVCYSLLIPGVNLKIRVKYKDNSKKLSKSKKKNKGNKSGKSRYLSYECLNCHSEYKYMDALVQKGDGCTGETQMHRTPSIFDMNLNFKSRSTTPTVESDSGKLNDKSIKDEGKKKIDSSGGTGKRKNTDTMSGGGKGDQEKTMNNRMSKSRTKKRKQMNSLSSMLSKKRKNDEASKKGGLDLFDFMS
ncbi:unnamed protein product [Ambrosiozyma monospora]|uniref:Unnamed protein product n=1 Tax=Ambrosiozyma monospora TaxID=43982 RepID=A0A9W6Z3N4_AMBMO|nr:unnamed protein product [Ambrosiozyma monospora]